MTVYNLHPYSLLSFGPQFNSDSISTSGGRRRRAYIYFTIKAKFRLYNLKQKNGSDEGMHPHMIPGELYYHEWANTGFEKI